MHQCRTETETREPDAEPSPECPDCGKPMRQWTARSGDQAGKPFWGCTAYPESKGTRKIPPQ